MGKTFLQLCADVARESGAVGSAPSTIVNQTGRQAKIVEWVRQACEQICADSPDWTFLRAEFTGDLSADVMSYAPGAWIDGSFARWLAENDTYQPMSIYPSGLPEQETELHFISYDRWRSMYYRRVHDALQPIHWSIAPDRSFLVGPKPDAAYVVRGEYQMGPQTLAEDDDVPIIPDQYQDAITWRACMMLAEHDEAPGALQVASRKYGAILTNMGRDLLPAIELGGNALA
jgi:hypothetical protein